MDRNELRKELTMSYNDLVTYLLKKYGGATADYFCTPTCKSRSSKIGRTKEGLLCHHIDEDKGGNLSSSYSASLQPFTWQKKERLVYCNYLEHLILHIKIAVLRQRSSLKTPMDVWNFFSTGGIFMVCEDINKLFSGTDDIRPWQRHCLLQIEDNYPEYLELLNLILYYIDRQYIGERSGTPLLQNGSVYHFSDVDATVVRFNEADRTITLRFPDGRERNYDIFWHLSQFTYDDMIRLIHLLFVTGWSPVSDDFRSALSSVETDFSRKYYENLRIDYHGFGFPEFAGIPLDPEEYGCDNADEYISMAFPSYSTDAAEIRGRIPVFWKGRLPRRVTASKHPYLVRVRAVFRIKPGQTPFIQYKQVNPLRLTDECFNNQQRHLLTFREGRVVTSTFIYDKRTNAFYPKYYGLSGKIEDSDLIVSMTREDYALMKTHYQVLKCEVLDGCYFVPASSAPAGPMVSPP